MRRLNEAKVKADKNMQGFAELPFFNQVTNKEAYKDDKGTKTSSVQQEHHVPELLEQDTSDEDELISSQHDESAEEEQFQDDSDSEEANLVPEEANEWSRQSSIRNGRDEEGQDGSEEFSSSSEETNELPKYGSPRSGSDEEGEDGSEEYDLSSEEINKSWPRVGGVFVRPHPKQADDISEEYIVYSPIYQHNG